MDRPEDLGLREDLDAALRDGQHPLDALAQILDRAGRVERRPIAAPATAGPWQLVRLLGMGGMGITYEAAGPNDAIAAVKLTGIVTTAHQSRFEAECQALMCLEHPRIVRYRGHGFTESGDGWLAMDLLRGETLQEILDQAGGEIRAGAIAARLLAGGDTTPPWHSPHWHRRMLRLLLAAAEGLAAAHARGIVHRDLKPANILVGADLEPSLIDFGLSRDLFRAVSLTRSGDLLGTWAYMAPEQLRGQADRADARTDVFALGLVLYRALFGVDLRQSPHDILRRGHRPLLLDRNQASRLPVPVQAILYRCLETNPQRRYPSAAELAEDLRAVLGDGLVTARRPGRCARWLRSRMALPAGLGFLALLGAVLLWVSWPEEERWLTVDGVRDPVNGAQIDGGRRYHMPARLPVHLGENRIRIEHLELEGPIERVVVVTEDRHHYCENFITVGNSRCPLWSQRLPVDAPSQVTAGAPAFLHVRVPDNCLELSLNAKPLPNVDQWWRVPAGPCTLVARSAAGEERQELRLSSNEGHAVTLLAAGSEAGHPRSRALLDMPGRFRRTVASLLSPLPPNVRLVDLDDGVVVRLNSKRDREYSPTIQAKSALTAVVPGRELHGTLQVDFGEERMRSLVFLFWANENQPARLQFHWRVDQGPWQEVKCSSEGPVPQKATYWRRHWSAPTEATRLPAEGVQSLEVRATMWCADTPTDYPSAEAFIGVADPADPALPCFAVVADPDPGVARLPR